MPARTKPMPRGTAPLPRGDSLKRGGPLRYRSVKTAAMYRDERVPFVRDLMAQVTRCEAPLAYRQANVPDPLPHCWGPLEPHERRRRSQQGSLTNRLNVLAICAAHHQRCTDATPGSPEHVAQLVAFRGDPEWEALGR